MVREDSLIRVDCGMDRGGCWVPPRCTPRPPGTEGCGAVNESNQVSQEDDSFRGMTNDWLARAKCEVDVFHMGKLGTLVRMMAGQ